ncbi:hypothetical protein Fcan01_24489 [Folsomia candida]|uniref:Uncharacterized protein n=1 Tax=Folsomia candida TaxID=158441 RepID=A0A226D6E0_FOLCA|nr:hypothetical protein Fcan01_24489 [Folsomia candida]
MSRIGIALVEGYTWTMAASIAGFTIIVVLTYPVEMILLWITLLRRKIQVAVNPNLLTKYRFVQITTKLFNDLWKIPAMSAMVATCVIVEIVALFILTTSLDKLPLPIIGLFLLLAIIFFNVIQGLFKVLSKPFENSNMFIIEIRTGRHSAWVKRFMRSCPPVKISMGNGAYFDGLSALVIWQFCIDNLRRLALQWGYSSEH